MAPLMEGCQHLTTAHLANMASLNWMACQKTSEKWGPKCLTKLVVRSVGLNEKFGIIMSKFKNLIDLELDGPAMNLKVGAWYWYALLRHIICLPFAVSIHAYRFHPAALL